MQRFFRFVGRIGRFFKKGDMVLLFLCLLASGFGTVCVASATNHMGSTRFVLVQLVAIALGVLLYFFFTAVDFEMVAEWRGLLLLLNTFLLLLLIPFGTDGGTGNKSWLDLPGMPFMLQPAEICKIFYTIILAKVMSIHRGKLSRPRSVFHMAFHMLYMVALIVVLSHDDGVALIFVFIFAIMAYAGGVSLWWFAGGLLGIALAWKPLVWDRLLDDYQRQRILMIVDSSIDPDGSGIRWQTVRSLRSLTGGGLTGQGLFNGTRTQAGALYAQHTDFIFSSIGEELGLLGCLFTLALLFAIVARCFYVARRAPSYLSKMICIGTAAAMIFQICVNVGMCIGVMPVIGLTLPFISYGGSSMVSMFMAMGVVSSIYAHPAPDGRGRYVRSRTPN